MNTVNGYYSLIQYCPDFFRAEVANVGVLLYCPAFGFLSSRISRDNTNVRKKFGQLNIGRINDIKRCFHDRLEIEKGSIQGLAELEDFIARRANNLLITKPRAIQIVNPETTLEKLFHELFGEAKSSSDRKNLFPILWKRIKENELTDRIDCNIEEIPLPIFHRTVKPKCGFQNGRFNIVRSETFIDSGRYYSALCRDAIDGQQLYKTPHEKYGEMKLIVLGNFRSNKDPYIPGVKQMLAAHNVDLITQSELDQFVEMIRNTAKPLQ